MRNHTSYSFLLVFYLYLYLSNEKGTGIFAKYCVADMFLFEMYL